MTGPLGQATVTGARRSTLMHQLLPYSDPQALLDVAVPFVRNGLAAGERVLVIANAANIALLGDHIDAAAVDLLDAHIWYQSPGHAMAGLHEYLLQTGGIRRPTRVVGEPIWDGLSAAAAAEWSCYEAAFNLAFAAVPMWVICPYDTARTPAPVLADALRTHPQLVGSPGGAQRRYVDPREFVPTGEPERAPAPTRAAVLSMDRSDPEDLRRFVLRQARDVGGLFGHLGHRLALAAYEIGREATARNAVLREVRLWTQPEEIVCEIVVERGDRPRVEGYLPPRGHAPGGGCWLARQLCDLVQPRRIGDHTVFRLHLYDRPHAPGRRRPG